MDMRDIIALIEDEQIDEVKMITHSETDEKEMIDHLQWKFDLHKGRADSGTWGTSWTNVGRLKNYDIFTPAPINRFNPVLFFMDSEERLMGFANLVGGRHHDPEAVTMRLIYFRPEARGKGDAFAVYLWALAHDFVIESDTLQTPMSRALWKRLAQTPGVRVQVHGGQDGAVIGDDIDLAYTDKLEYLSARKG